MAPAIAPLRILLVEDELANRELVRAILDSLGDEFLRRSTLEGAASLAEARRALAAADFDVVLLDLWLPDGDGLTLADEIWAIGSGRPVIIVISGSAQPVEQIRALRVVDEFLLKPFEPVLLVETIKRLTRHR